MLYLLSSCTASFNEVTVCHVRMQGLIILHCISGRLDCWAVHPEPAAYFPTIGATLLFSGDA